MPEMRQSFPLGLIAQSPHYDSHRPEGKNLPYVQRFVDAQACNKWRGPEICWRLDNTKVS